MLLLSKRKKVPPYLDEEGDFVLACLRTCESNLWETILGCILYQDDVLLGVAFLVDKSPYLHTSKAEVIFGKYIIQSRENAVLCCTCLCRRTQIFFW